MNQRTEERTVYLESFAAQMVQMYEKNGPFSFHKPKSVNLRVLIAEIKKCSDEYVLVHIELQWFAVCNIFEARQIFPIKNVAVFQ